MQKMNLTFFVTKNIIVASYKNNFLKYKFTNDNILLIQFHDHLYLDHIDEKIVFLSLNNFLDKYMC